MGAPITPSPILNQAASSVLGCFSISRYTRDAITNSVATMHTIATILFNFFLLIMIIIILKCPISSIIQYKKHPFHRYSNICTANVSKTSSIWDINQCIERSENGSSNSTALSRTMLFISITYYHHDSNG